MYLFIGICLKIKDFHKETMIWGGGFFRLWITFGAHLGTNNRFFFARNYALVVFVGAKPRVFKFFHGQYFHFFWLKFPVAKKNSGGLAQAFGD